MTTSLSLTPRRLLSETILKDRSVTVIPPCTGEDQATRELVAKLKALGSRVVVMDFSEGDSLKAISGPVIVWGNLANNNAVRELYFKFLLVTDCRYPGPAGYELRTLMNPFGTGDNILHLGYSDDEGLRLGWEKLLAQLAPVTPRLAEVKATALPMADFMAEAIRAADFPPLDWMLAANVNNTFKGYLGYLEGDGGLIAHSQEVWRRILAYGIPAGDHNIKDLHLRMSLLICSFRMLETAGLIDEELRAPILEFFIKWINSDQGVAHLSFEGTVVPGIQRQNHGTIPALALSYFASYLRDFYPEITAEPKLWEEISDKVFSVYWDGSWKPASEGLCHGWYLEQPVLLEYGLLDPKHRFFKNDGARRAADCAMAVVNNFGWMPASGDAHLLRSFPSDSLRTAAAWYRNEEYRFADLTAPDYRRLRSHVFLPRAFDIGVKGQTPPAGLTVVPLDPLVHGAHDKAPDAAPWMFKVPPSAPVEECFDKVTMREGWNREDAYLLIDGIGGGSHAYDDAMDLIEYSRLGYSFLVSDSGLQSPEPDSHSIVTVGCDGVCDLVPCFGECHEATWDRTKGRGYARLALRGNNGSTWTRELFFLGQQGLVIHDYIEAEREGDFSIQCNLRIPGKVEHESGQTVAHRPGAEGGEVVFSLQSTIHETASLRVVEDDKRGQIRHVRDHENTPPEDDVVEAWSRRYGTKDIQISIVRSRLHTHLKKGEGVSFVHYAHARLATENAPSLRVAGSRGLVIEGFPKSIELQSHFDLGLNSGSSALPAEQSEIVGRSKPVLCELGAEIKKIVPLNTGNVLIVLMDGRCIRFDSEWNRIWETSVEGPVHDADADGEQIYVGHAADSLTALSLRDGEVRWTIALERIPSSCPWWEWFSTAALRVVAARPQSGFTGVVVGCGDMHVRAYTREGEHRWTFRYMNGIPGTIGLMDVNGDGVDEILVGGEIMSNRAECRLLKAGGALLQEMEVEWWTSRMTAQARSEENGRWAAFGANWGRNLHFVEMKPGAVQPMHKRWLKYLPGGTTALLIDAPKKHLLVGNSLGLFYCFDFDGTLISRMAFDGEVAVILRMGSGFVIGLANGRAHWVSIKDSGVIGSSFVWNGSGDWSKVVPHGNGLLLPQRESLSWESLENAE